MTMKVLDIQTEGGKLAARDVVANKLIPLSQAYVSGDDLVLVNGGDTAVIASPLDFDARKTISANVMVDAVYTLPIADFKGIEEVVLKEAAPQETVSFAPTPKHEKAKYDPNIMHSDLSDRPEDLPIEIFAEASVLVKEPYCKTMQEVVLSGVKLNRRFLNLKKGYRGKGRYNICVGMEDGVPTLFFTGCSKMGGCKRVYRHRRLSNGDIVLVLKLGRAEKFTPGQYTYPDYTYHQHSGTNQNDWDYWDRVQESW